MKAFLKMGDSEVRCEGEDCQEFIAQFKQLINDKRNIEQLSLVIEYLTTSRKILKGNPDYEVYINLILDVENKLIEEKEIKESR